MNDTAFIQIVNETLNVLENIAKNTPQKITACKSGESFEIVVYDALSQVLQTRELDPQFVLDYEAGSHRFPDIIITLNSLKYGIEVKSSSSKAKGWKINGNSIMGSTKAPDVIETYIIFGKTNKANLSFKSRKYEDCIANVVVTHSPRYYIDMDLSEEDNFFHKSCIDYESLSESKDPIGIITNYFRQIGQKAWWLSESTPANIRMFSDLPLLEKSKLTGYGYAHFPELFDNGNKKYKRLSIWLIMEQSIAAPSLRDDFTAGGQADLICEDASLYCHMPRKFITLKNVKKYVLQALDDATPDDLIKDWDSAIKPTNALSSKVKCWINVVSRHIRQKDVDGKELLQSIFHEYK